MTVTNLPAWQKLRDHRNAMDDVHMRDLFAEDSNRFQRYSLTLQNVLFDYSKNRLTDETLRLLIQLAEQTEVPAAIEAMFAGAKLNTTEDRPALHVALRNRRNDPIYVDGEDVMPRVNAVLNQMRNFCEQVQTGRWRGYTDKPITDVVNIGIGGSDLGPRMAAYALRPYAKGSLQVHFVSNVDPSEIGNTLALLDPETTLFIVASKSFTTQETMLNAQRARRWLVQSAGEEEAVSRHFVAISTNEPAVRAFGIDENNMFQFWDWVGGRYSIWSAIGLPVALYIGMDNFERLLEGAHVVDEHFRTAPMEDNIPVLMALIGVWYVNFWNAPTYAVLPYDHYLKHFVDYLQQLDTESNGKRFLKAGGAVDYNTGPIVWGRPGTDGQHAFYQLLHQGTHVVPADFLVAARNHDPTIEQHNVLLSHCLAQTKALMEGRTFAATVAELEGSGPGAGPEAGPEAGAGAGPEAGPGSEQLTFLAEAKTFPGNQPTNTFLYERLTPKTLGMLLALYEHKVFVQGAIWGINSFDQMGVELGKQLANKIHPVVAGQTHPTDLDSSTKGLIEASNRWS